MKTAIINIGHIFTGDIHNPETKASCIVMEDGVIVHVGDDTDVSDCHVVADAAGATIMPGLIDTHVHITFGDYTPRQKTVDFLESYVHGGITTSVSASEVHTPGRPKDREGVKALAVAAQRCFADYRPGGMKVYAGSVILEPGLEIEDFAELRNKGVWLAKAGFGAFADPKEYRPYVQAAREQGFIVMCHTGGSSIPGSSPVTADALLAMQPNVSYHVNGGPTAMSDDDLERVIRDSDIALQIVQAGNLRSALRTVGLAKQYGQLQRLLIASDTPTGTGTMPLAVLKSMVEMSSMLPDIVTPGEMIAAATGNASLVYGFTRGMIREGYAADVLIVDAPLGGVATEAKDAIINGDLPAIAMCFADGVLRYTKSRNTPPPARRGIRVIQERLKVWM